MKRKLENLLFLLRDNMGDLLGEITCSSGHEYNTQIFRPFYPNQYEEKFLQKMKPFVDDFLENTTEEYKNKFLNTRGYKDYEYIQNPIPTSSEGEYAPNYAVVIINDCFYLLENNYYRSNVRFGGDVYYLNKDTIDMYSFVNVLANTKNNYYIGIDDFSYFLGKPEKEYRYSEIQLGFEKEDFRTVKLSYINEETNVVIEDKNGSTITKKLKKDKAFIIAKDFYGYCQEVKLKSNGFEIIEGLEGEPIKEINMFPDIRVLDTCTFLSKEPNDLNINCSNSYNHWYSKIKEKLENLIKSSKLNDEFYIFEGDIKEDDDMPF